MKETYKSDSHFFPNHNGAAATDQATVRKLFFDPLPVFFLLLRRFLLSSFSSTCCCYAMVMGTQPPPTAQTYSAHWEKEKEARGVSFSHSPSISSLLSLSSLLLPSPFHLQLIIQTEGLLPPSTPPLSLLPLLPMTVSAADKLQTCKKTSLPQIYNERKIDERL